MDEDGQMDLKKLNVTVNRCFSVLKALFAPKQ